MTAPMPSNAEIADALERVADLLPGEDANPYRVQAYRRAAASVRDCDESVATTARDRPNALKDLPDIGHKLGGAIEEYVRTGRIPLLERLESEVEPDGLLQRVPGIGPGLAERIVDELGVGTLEELEEAAWDGRLGQVEGFGQGRVQAVRDSLAAMLSRRPPASARRPAQADGVSTERPAVDLLLEVDTEYRRRAQAGELTTIAPRRFNPEGKAWLPIMRRRRDGWSFTALYSNTKRAHDLGATRDWVVIYYHPDGDEGQCTVVTAQRGTLAGKRVVRGREPECRRYYGNDE